MVDEHGEMIDATIDKMEAAGVLAGTRTDEPCRVIKEVTLHGIPCKVFRRVDNGTTFFRAEVARKGASQDGFCDHAYQESAGFWPASGSDETEADALGRAMEWVDQRAYVLSMAIIVDKALSQPVYYVSMANDYEPWVEVAKLCTRDGLHVIDDTAMMDSPEVGHNIGGVWTRDDGVNVRCELVTCFEAGGKWLAVYDCEVGV